MKSTIAQVMVGTGLGLLSFGCFATLNAQNLAQPLLSTNVPQKPAKNLQAQLFPQHSPTAAIARLNERPLYRSLDLAQISEAKNLLGSDPKAIAGAVFGAKGDSGEGNYFETIALHQADPKRPIVILTKMNLSDDSVRGIRYRLEFQPNPTPEATWQMVWAGQQQICWQGRGPQTWTTQHCS
jgi:hypothetical protein